MKNIFSPGAEKHYRVRVKEEDLARFESGEVHPVYGTFALGRDAEWVCRLFVLDIKEEGEEGIGIALSVEHVSPAVLGSEVSFVGVLEEINGKEIWCRFEARVGDRLIARGRTRQKIIDKPRFDAYLETLK